MWTWLIIVALAVTAGAQTVEPPVVGQPRDFSGAVGGPFTVEQIATPTELAIEESLTLTVRITGRGNLRDLPRPPLAKLEAYKSFAVDDLTDRYIDGDRPRREFDYKLRPRTADVKAVPRLKFVYFNPQIGTDARGYQTRYAYEVPLTVRPRTPPAVAIEVPEWILKEFEARHEVRLSEIEQWCYEILIRLGLDPFPVARNRPGLLIGLLAMTGPLLVCGIWYVVWRHRNPDAARLALWHRSRAGTAALRDLRKATGGDAVIVNTVFCEYLRARSGLPVTATTPAEVGAFLRNSGCAADRVTAIEDILRRCDRARFSSEQETLVHISADAKRVILDLEAAP